MRFLAGALSIACASAMAGCGASHVSLRERPTDAGSARDLATTVSDHADCGNFEDYQLHPADYWTFTCQKPGRMFLIRTDATATKRNELINTLKSHREPYRSGAHFLVYEFHAADHVNTAADLNSFPGDLVKPH